MSQNIQDFYTQVVNKDFARQHQFRIGDWAVDNTNFIDEKDFVYLETATLPGRAINNVAVPFMGMNFNVPGTASYPGSDSYAVTFRCDSSYDLRSKLEAATFKTFNDENSNNNYDISKSSNLTLQLLDKTMKPVRTYNLYGVWVVSVGDLSYNLGDNGTIQTVPVTLAYQYWRPIDTSSKSTTYTYVAG